MPYHRLVGRGLCSPPPAKAYGFRSGEQNLHRGRRRKSRYCRLAGRGLCSPPPAKAYGFVRGAKSSQRAAAEIVLLPATGSPTLLPAARKVLRLRFGEQNLHTKRRRKSLYCRLAGRRLCSTPLAKAYGFVSWSKIFTKGGGENRVIAGSPAADFAPRRPQRLTASFGGAKSSHKAAAKIVILPARRPRTLLPAARKGLRLRPGEQNLHTRRRRKSLYCRLAGRGLCSPPPAKAYGFVRGSKIFTQGGGENRFIAGSPAADFAPRRPQRLTASYRGAKSSHKAAAEIALLLARRPPPLLPAARKGLRLRSGEQNLHTRRRRKSLYCRLAGRGLCSPPPAKAYGFVRGSKIFTQGGGENRFIAGSPAADFAPRRPQRLTASYRGAKSSHKAAAEIALLLARRPPTLLPTASKGLRLRFGEQNLHTRRRRKSRYCRLAGRRFCSPPPAKAYGFVLGSKIFTEGGGENRLISGSPAAAFAPRRPQRLTASFGGAKSSHKAAAESALLPARRPPTLLPAARKGLRLRTGEQNLHTGRRRKSSYHRLAGRRLCSPPPAKAYGFVSGSKKFTQSGGGSPIPAPVSAAAVENEKGY